MTTRVGVMAQVLSAAVCGYITALGFCCRRMMQTGALVLQDTSAPTLQLTLQQQTLVRPQTGPTSPLVVMMFGGTSARIPPALA